MSLEIAIFRPARLKVVILCFLIFAAILAAINYLSESNRIAFYFLLALLFMAFFYFLVPVLKNQKFLVGDDYLKIFSFGSSCDVRFSRDLYEIVVKDSEVVSYRFEKDGKRFQISPDAYHEADEVKRIFSALLKTAEQSISIVER